MQRLDFRAMGCQMLALLDLDDADASEALTLVPGWFEEWEASLSRFREESELSALNRSSGQWVRVSETMWQMIQEAMSAAGESDGLVTPALLDQLKTAGYDRTFELLNRSLPAPSSVSSRPVLDWRAIELDENDHRLRVPDGMHLDFGGIAKGWAAQQAAKRLSDIAPALVDAGGDIAMSAARANGERWPIAVADPFRADSDLELLMIAQGGVATSGRDYRRWRRNGKWQHHIIDPRTGAPAETNVLSVTILARTTTAAEVAAKVVLILGGRAGLEWIEAREELAALIVLDDGQVLHSRRLDEYVWQEPPALPIDPVLVSWSRNVQSIK